MPSKPEALFHREIGTVYVRKINGEIYQVKQRTKVAKEGNVGCDELGGNEEWDMVESIAGYERNGGRGV
jgi:hypothetical protein